jgi:hypothetical protein
MQLVFMISRGRALRGSAHHITQMMLAAVAFSKGRELKARGAAWRGWLPGNLEIAWIAHLSLHCTVYSLGGVVNQQPVTGILPFFLLIL